MIRPRGVEHCFCNVEFNGLTDMRVDHKTLSKGTR